MKESCEVGKSTCGTLRECVGASGQVWLAQWLHFFTFARKQQEEGPLHLAGLLREAVWCPQSAHCPAILPIVLLRAPLEVVNDDLDTADAVDRAHALLTSVAVHACVCGSGSCSLYIKRVFIACSVLK